MVEARYIVVRLIIDELALPWNYDIISNTFHDLHVKGVFEGYEPWFQTKYGTWCSRYLDEELAGVWNAREIGDLSHEDKQLISSLRFKLRHYKQAVIAETD